MKSIIRRRDVLKIVLISPNTIPVPPIDYGGTQRIIYYLTEELVRRGHEVILFAKEGSNTTATQTYEYPSDDIETHLEFIIRHIPDDADIIHDHYGIVATANPPIPTIRNSHSKRVVGVQIPVYVSKTILNKYGKNNGYFVYNGIRLKDYKYEDTKNEYLLYLGRIMERKGVHLAIEVAKKTGKELIIAGTLNNNKIYEDYFDSIIRPHLNEQIRYVGPIGGNEKQELLSKASCVLFPSTWNEPFGLVLIEALACGTPVLGFRKGGVQEVLKGLPQLLCDNTKDMAAKVLDRTGLPSAKKCRSYVRKYFTDRIMTDHFLELYDKIIKEKKYKIIPNSLWNELKVNISGKELNREVSIIACTMRPSYMVNIFSNYEQQKWKNKELIVILNKDDMDLLEWRERAKQFQNVRVYKLPEEYTLGKCLNWAIAMAKGSIIAKFDDDDYYAPRYLKESVYALMDGKAPIIGKHTSYVYFEETKALMLYRAGRENKLLGKVKGGTLLFRKSVWLKVKFPEDRVGGSDSHWLKNCITTGFKVYSVSKDYYVCVRREDTESHTQKRSTSTYMSNCELVGYTDNFIPYITKKINILDEIANP
jgi:glycosyltransferase involved in cell wall biosynthesis